MLIGEYSPTERLICVKLSLIPVRVWLIWKMISRKRSSISMINNFACPHTAPLRTSSERSWNRRYVTNLNTIKNHRNEHFILYTKPDSVLWLESPCSRCEANHYRSTNSLGRVWEIMQFVESSMLWIWITSQYSHGRHKNKQTAFHNG